MNEMEEIIKEFLVESNDNLDQLDRDLVDLEKDPQSSELLGRIFRAIHTVKGTSGVLGFSKLESVAHVGENLFSRMRDGKLRLNAEITTGLLKMVDAIREVLRSIEASGVEGEGDYSKIIAMLKDLLDREMKRNAQPPLGEIIVQQTEHAVQEALEAQHAGDPRKLGEILVERGSISTLAVNEALNAQQSETVSHVSGSSIRVDVNLLDKLMNLVGELVLARNQILQFTGTQKDASFLGTAQRLNLITTELQEGVMKTRMQPIGNVWNKFPRVVRDLANQFSKPVKIEMEGSETELDKTIIEAIKDPLTHILRNAVDHGIESPEERTQKGKPAEGTVSLRAFHEGGQVNIEIIDDGKGLDTERIKQKALERGQISQDQAAAVLSCAPKPVPIPASVERGGPLDIVVIGCSTGGPNALSEILPQLPEDFPVPVVVVQHMPPTFTKFLAERLNTSCRLRVVEAGADERLEPGTIWIAPGDYHISVYSQRTAMRLRRHQAPPENSCRPAVDVLFRTTAMTYGRRALAVILTGMGQDGLRGAQELKSVNATVIAQDEVSSVVWGMPGFVVQAGLADRVVPLGQMAQEITRRVIASQKLFAVHG